MLREPEPERWPQTKSNRTLQFDRESRSLGICVAEASDDDDFDEDDFDDDFDDDFEEDFDDDFEDDFDDEDDADDKDEEDAEDRLCEEEVDVE